MPEADRAEILIAIAREAIADRAGYALERDWPHAWLDERAATFVTLRLDGELRGCIGTLEAVRPLGSDVSHNAWAAAYRDPRFSPVTSAEISLLHVEVSLLSAREPLSIASERDALAQLRPGIDGIVLEYGERRATFLPQVWEGLPDPLDFLSELRRKARLPARFWHPDVKLSRYTVEKYQ